MEPLAYKMRPKKFEDIIGQDHLVGPTGVLNKMLQNKRISSFILYGPPGIGKTTIAFAMCSELNAYYHTFNASTDNKAYLKDIIEASISFEQSIIIIDEIHRMKKDIQDYLLPHVEKGTIRIIGLTTINPYHSVNPAIRSRCMIFKMRELQSSDLNELFLRAIHHLDEPISFSEEAKEYLVLMANSDARTLLNMIETVALSSDKISELTLKDVKAIILKPSVQMDKNEDNYFDTLSGLQKSIRGSDVNASIFYLAKLLYSEDLLPLVRRLYAIFYEDISLANPQLGPRLRAACEAALELGMPEARLPFASIVVDMALSPKSNSTYLAIDKALKDIEDGNSGPLPIHLKNIYSFDPSQKSYLYPHDFPGAWVNQQYLPDKLISKIYYEPKTTSKYEEALSERLKAIENAKKQTK